MDIARAGGPATSEWQAVIFLICQTPMCLCGRVLTVRAWEGNIKAHPRQGTLFKSLKLSHDNALKCYRFTK